MQLTFSQIKPEMIQNESVITDICVAPAGTYDYNGSELVLDDYTFNELINNFESGSQALPVFKGHADVNGSMTGEEVESHGWILGLTKDLLGNLWAKVEFSLSMANTILDGGFKYCSIFFKEETDRKTGKEIGNRMVSLALTNEPYLPDLPQIILSNKQNKFQMNIYSNKEPIKMNKVTSKKKVVLSNTELAEQQTLPEAVESAELMNDLQEGKTSDVISEFDANASLMEVLPEGMSLEDFVKSLLDCYAMAGEKEDETVMAETVKEEVVTETETEKETPAEQKTDTEEVKKEEAKSVVASSIGSKALSAMISENKKLKKELEDHKESVLLSSIDSAINQGATQLHSMKSKLIALGKVDKDLFDFQIEQARKNPELKLGRFTHDKELNSKNTVLSSIQDNMSKMSAGEKEILGHALAALNKRK